MCIYVYICMIIYKYMYMYMYISMCIYVCIYVYIYIYMNVHRIQGRHRKTQLLKFEHLLWRHNNRDLVRSEGVNVGFNQKPGVLSRISVREKKLGD